MTDNITEINGVQVYQKTPKEDASTSDTSALSKEEKKALEAKRKEEEKALKEKEKAAKKEADRIRKEKEKEERREERKKIEAENEAEEKRRKEEEEKKKNQPPPVVYVPNEDLELDKKSAYVTMAETRRRKIENGVAKELDPTIKRYYSAIEAEIYLGSEFVEDVSSIHYAIRQNNMPVFGYNSYTYDELAIGSRIIEGYFTINFTTPNYLFKLLEEIDGVASQQNFFLKKAYAERNLLEPIGAIDKRFDGHVNGHKYEELYPKTFDIDIVYGGKTRVGNPAHVIITGVRIISCEVQISAHDPNSLVEAYTFIGQDIRTIQ